MQFRTLAIVAVALLVALSGCSAFGGPQTDSSSDDAETNGSDVEDVENSNETTNETDEDADAEDEADDEDGADTDDEENETDGGIGDENDQTGADDDTADAEWTPPKEPNQPLEDEREDRIESVEFVDTEPAENGEGYSNFNLEIVANTSMENVDPPEHGDVVGEPYFFVKINEGPDNRKIVERTEQVEMDENGTFHIDVRPAGLEEFGAGALTVEVFLMDEDKDWDDIYDAVAVEIEFNPDGADGEDE